VRKRWIVLLVFAGFAAVIGVTAYQKFLREEPAPYFATDEEHFLFGSIGTEHEQGIPYWIWLVLPRVFPEHLPGPGGYGSLGLVSRDGHELPVGFSKKTIGFPRVGINCAMCHAASVRLRPEDPPTIYPAAPSHQTGEQEYLRFLFACASDPRFTSSTILAEISRNTRLSLLDRLIYRTLLIPFTRRALLQLKDSNSWMHTKPDWGRGRIDPFNPVKFGILRQPVDETIGNSDMMPVWNLKKHAGFAYHWDGLNPDLTEVVLSSALGDGATQDWVDEDRRRWDMTGDRISSLRRIQNFISDVPPPAYPFAIDKTLAAEGEGVYKDACASCHAFGGARTGKIIPVAEVGTDPHRLKMWTAAAATAYNSYNAEYSWKFERFRSTEGYVAVSLDGLWLRAPYLHNGSVPSLTDLLEPVERRPASFWRGYDVYDPVRIGFVSSGPAAERYGTLHDIRKPGNSNAGHVYGTTLTEAQKRALLEFLKTQ
jgi:hypothetical protein